MGLTIPDDLVEQAKAAGIADPVEYLRLQVIRTIDQVAAREDANGNRTTQQSATGLSEHTLSPPRRSFYDAAEACGFIGGAKYEPDLSSNPQHLQGFGQ